MVIAKILAFFVCTELCVQNQGSQVELVCDDGNCTVPCEEWGTCTFNQDRYDAMFYGTLFQQLFNYFHLLFEPWLT